MLDYLSHKVNRRRLAGPLLLVLLAGAAFAPVDVPYTIESMAQILPASEWRLTKSNDGFLSTALHNHLSGKLVQSEGFQFERGDFIKISFSDSTQYTERGTVIASIVSNKLEEQLNALQSELAIELSNKQVVATGEKEPLISQLEEEVNLAKESLGFQSKNFRRAQNLYSEGLIALAELEQAENTFNEAVTSVHVAEKALKVAATGEKKESISLVHSRITSLRQQIAFLEEKQQLLTITAPFDGIVRTESTLEGDQWIVEDTSATVLIIPVRLRDSQFFRPGQSVRIRFIGQQETVPCTILDLHNQVEFINRDEVIALKAITTAKNLPSGMPVRCVLHCDSVRVSEFLERSIQWF